MHPVLLAYLLFVFILPFPVASIYAYLRRVNKFLIIAPLVMVTLQLGSLYCLFASYGSVSEFTGFLIYFGCCFIAMIVGTVGLYYGFVRHQRHYGGETGMSVLRCFVYCFTLLVFPLVLGILWCLVVHRSHVPAERVAKKKPELAKRPSWSDVVEEKEKEKEGGE